MYKLIKCIKFQIYVIFYVIYQKLDFPFYSSSVFRFINLKKKKTNSILILTAVSKFSRQSQVTFVSYILLCSS